VLLQLIGEYIAVPGLASLTWIKWGGAKEISAPADRPASTVGMRLRLPPLSPCLPFNPQH
jgi:hypothetical protein